MVQTEVFLSPTDEWEVRTIDPEGNAFEVLSLGEFPNRLRFFSGYGAEAVQCADRLIAAATEMRDRAAKRLGLDPTLDFDALMRRLDGAPDVAEDQLVDAARDAA